MNAYCSRIGRIFALGLGRLVLMLALLWWAALDMSAAVRHNALLQEKPEALFEKAEALRLAEKTDSALIFYSWLVETHRGSDNPINYVYVGKALSEMGQLYYIQYNDYLSAYKCLAEAEAILSASEDTADYAVVLLNLGNLFNIYESIFPPDGQSLRGKDYYERSFDVAVGDNNVDLACSAYINLVMLDLPFSVDRDLNQRMQTIMERYAGENVEDYALTKSLCDGTGAILANDPDRARGIFKSMRDSIGLEADRDKFMADLCLSAVAVSEQDYEEAIKCLSRILETPSDKNNADVYMEVYNLMSIFYSKIGDQQMAEECRIKFFEVKEGITNQMVELEPTRLGIELGQVRDYAHRLDAEKKQTTIMLVFAAFIMLITGIVAFVIYRKNRQLTLKNTVIFNQMRSLIAEPDSEKAEKYRDSSMTDDTRRELIDRVEKAMADVAVICDPTFTLQKLTTLVGSNTSYISRAINEHYGMSFGALLSERRVREACRRMADFAVYGNYTIDAISESVGFKTRPTFTKAFRQHIGMLPSEYMKLLRTQSSPFAGER